MIRWLMALIGLPIKISGQQAYLLACNTVVPEFKYSSVVFIMDEIKDLGSFFVIKFKSVDFRIKPVQIRYYEASISKGSEIIEIVAYKFD